MTNKIEMDMIKVHKMREEGKTFKEIAEMYDCHRSTVNRRYNRWKAEVNPHGVTKVSNLNKKDSWLDKVKNFFYKLLPNIETRW